jgi:hypothetical protein
MPARFLYGNEEEKLKEMMIKVSMFSGHSGVGNQLWLMLWNLRCI